MNMGKLIFSLNSQDRKKLSEGRDYGMGFAFCKLAGDVLSAIMPISPCKDYLNDVVFTEATGKPFSAYGLHTKKLDIFSNGCGYLAFSICKQGRNEHKYEKYDRDVLALNTNYKSLQKFIHFFEKAFGIKQKTKIKKLADNLFVAIVPPFWLDGTYKISLYSLLLRAGAFYTGDKEPMVFIDAFNFDNSDQMILNSCKPKIVKMMGGTIPKQDLANLKNVHHTGILGFNF